MNTYDDAIEAALKDKLTDLVSVVFTNLAEGRSDAEVKANFERGLAILEHARIILQQPTKPLNALSEVACRSL